MMSTPESNCVPFADKSGTARSPDILLVVVDDMGWSDLGAFGGEIDTPVLDGLALAGARLTNFHASPLCSTTRAMLMTGRDHHEVGFGNLAEMLTPAQRDQPGYEGQLNRAVPTIAERLREAGYLTMVSGKWHLGEEPESSPFVRGFEHSFVLLQGEHNHFGHDQAEHAPGPLGRSRYERDGCVVKFPVGSYSSYEFADRLIEFMRSAPADNRPWFSYLALTAPHSPLQAPADLIARYEGRYEDGPQALRQRRLDRMRELGLSVTDSPASELKGTEAWLDLEPDERMMQARKMQVYAAMIDCMDRSVGQVVDEIRRQGRFERTLIVFLSDNGPAGTLRETSAAWKPWIDAHADNRLGCVGSATSYVSMGSTWAQAQSAPFSLFKRYTTEGGVRTCAFVSGADVTPRKEESRFVHVLDLAHSLLVIGGVREEVIASDCLRGRDMSKALLGGLGAEPDAEYFWELAGSRAIRRGRWKAVYLPSVVSTVAPDLPVERWMLFDVSVDPGENEDLAERNPRILSDLVAFWYSQAVEFGVVASDRR